MTLCFDNSLSRLPENHKNIFMKLVEEPSSDINDSPGDPEKNKKIV